MSKAIFDYVTKLSDQLSFEERQKLIEHLSEPSQPIPAHNTIDLYGAWRGKFPDDIDAALNEIRAGCNLNFKRPEYHSK